MSGPVAPGRRGLWARGGPIGRHLLSFLSAGILSIGLAAAYYSGGEMHHPPAPSSFLGCLGNREKRGNPPFVVLTEAQPLGPQAPLPLGSHVQPQLRVLVCPS